MLINVPHITAHRTLIVRQLKGLEDIISFTAVHWHMGEKGMMIYFSFFLKWLGWI